MIMCYSFDIMYRPLHIPDTVENMTTSDHALVHQPKIPDPLFEKEGVVSVWAGLKDGDDETDDLDVLQDWCGIDYYDPDYQEMNWVDFRLMPLKELLQDLSYSDSFITHALFAAKQRGITSARWVLLQYNFAYDMQLAKLPIADDPIFLGRFKYGAAGL